MPPQSRPPVRAPRLSIGALFAASFDRNLASEPPMSRDEIVSSFHDDHNEKSADNGSMMGVQHHAAPQLEKSHAASAASPHTKQQIAISDELDDANAIERPAKRARLSVREKLAAITGIGISSVSPAATRPPTQTTLDRYNFAQVPQNRSEATTQTLSTTNDWRTHSATNGVGAATSAHDLSEDELLQPTPMPERAARRRTRSPNAAADSQGREAVASSLPQPAQKQQQKPEKPKQEEKRTLRSQDDGPRLKSELAIYFPNYEDIMFDTPRESEFLTVDTALYITDDPPKPAVTETSPRKSGKGGRLSIADINGRGSSNGGLGSLTPQRTLSNQYNGSPSLSLEMIAKTLPSQPEDPLTDEHYFVAHRRAERKEKQLRNIERERAMHEKVQLDRLLDGLQGHDWLKVLGITGITDGEARKYEVKRNFFISEVQALVDKFKLWKEQERKQKLEKEVAAAEAREAEDDEDDEDEESSLDSIDPPSSDLNASAARQLQQETAHALRASREPGKRSLSKAARPKHKLPSDPKHRHSLPSMSAHHPRTPQGKLPSTRGLHTSPRAASSLLPATALLPPSPEVPITSFYAKRHLRDAALGKLRNAGRNSTAFGCPLPEILDEDREFVLPTNYFDDDFLKRNERESRRRRRERAEKDKEREMKLKNQAKVSLPEL